MSSLRAILAEKRRTSGSGWSPSSVRATVGNGAGLSIRLFQDSRFNDDAHRGAQHFFRTLKPISHSGGWIGVVWVVGRIVPMPEDLDFCSLRQRKRFGQVINDLPAEIVAGNPYQSFFFSSRIYRANCHV